jgi:beta-glucanase (GH16 family)/glycerophosphoryl diester phosphodiesterase
MRTAYLLALIIVTASCNTQKHTTTLSTNSTDKKIVAHRGAWKLAKLPQNSIAALRNAIARNYAGSEFDVHMTADDTLVINHDPDYNKLAIEKVTYAQLQQYPLSNGERLPTLREYILAGMAQNNSTRLICEIKPSQISKKRGEAVAEKVLRLVDELDAAHMVDYISFDYNILMHIRQLNPKANTQYLQGDKSPQQLKMDGITGADYHYSVFQKKPEWIKNAQDIKLTLNAWTVDDPAVMDWLLANNFDYITTNEPALLAERMMKAPTLNGWKLAWSDEFNGSGLPDSTYWSFETGGHGFGNNELQYYTAFDTSNAKVSGGSLHITARNINREGRNYTSARLVTKDKIQWKYGRVEVRAKLPAGRGLWPAIWMLGSNVKTSGWPKCGEIDIMEHVGYNADTIFGTVHTAAFNHTKGTQKGAQVYIADPYASYHTYAIEWTPKKIDFMIDDSTFFTFANHYNTTDEWPFDQPFFLIMNVAVGGNFGGKEGVDDAAFPATMQVEAVRVFQKENY